MNTRTAWSLYGLLVALRLALALFSTGYIHPDEYFQGPEAALSDQLQAVKTWEFDPASPCRSMANVKLFNLPVVLLKWLSEESVDGWTLFITQRLTTFALSILVDCCLAALLYSSSRSIKLNEGRASTALLLYASSGATLSFALRSLTNNVESAILCVCFVLVQQLHREVEQWKTTTGQDRSLSFWSAISSLLGFLVALGTFSRFTFVVFAAPLGVYYIGLVWRLSGLATARTTVADNEDMSVTPASLRRPLKALILLSDSLNGLLLCSLAHVLYDTVYYRLVIQEAAHAASGSATQYVSLSLLFERMGITPVLNRLANLSSWPLTVAPWNALRYNMREENLAQHGLHPRWLHVGVNAPMIVGSAALWLGCCTAMVKQLGAFGPARRQRATGQELASFPLGMLSLCTIALSLAVLSSQPHQEPRFLLPLVAPAILLVVLGSDPGEEHDFDRSPSSTANAKSQTKLRTRRSLLRPILMTLHLLQAAGMVIFFSLAHQGGVAPALLRAGEEVHLLQDHLVQATNATAARTGSSLSSSSSSSDWFPDSEGKTGPVQVDVHFWRAFMPPRHLLALPLPVEGSKSDHVQVRVSVHDHSSQADPLLEIQRLRQEAASAGHHQLLVAPAWAMDPLVPTLQGRGRLEHLASFSPHLDADHLGEAWELIKARYERAMARRGLVGVGWMQRGTAAFEALRGGLALQVMRVSRTGAVTQHVEQ